MSRYTDRQKAHKEQDAKQLALDISAVMSLPAGRRLFMSILKSGGVYRKSTPEDDRAYVAGRRDAALEIMQAVNRHAVESAMLALVEQNNETERRINELEFAKNQDEKELKHA